MDAFQLLDQAMMSHLNREVVNPINPNVGTDALRVIDVKRMNPLEFYGSKVDEEPQEVIQEIYKALRIMGVPVEKLDLVIHQLKVWLKYGINNGRKGGRKMLVLLIGRSSTSIFLLGSFPLR